MGFTSTSDLVIALHADAKLEIPRQARAVVDRFTERAFGFIQVLGKPDPRVPPPIAWPISAACRTAVLCSDVFIVHLVDASAMLGPGAENSSIDGVATNRSQIVGFRASVGAKRHVLSAAFLDDVLFGFQTLDSTRQQMLAFARAIATMEAPAATKPWPPEAITVNTRSELLAVAEERSNERDRSTWVALPLELWDDLRERSKESGEPTGE